MKILELATYPVADSGSSALHAASPAAHAISEQLALGFLACALIFSIVFGAIAWCVVRFRRRGEGPHPEPAQVLGNLRLELTWTLLPFLLLVGLFTMTARAMHVADAPPIGAPEIIVTGHQWWWEARYVSTSNANGFVTANEIHIPVGRRVLLRIEAADVIHDFWVPQLARKVDAIPGHPNAVWLEADELGSYSGTCAEYCGTQHAWMRLQVVAQSPADYEQWLVAQRGSAAVATSASAERGSRLFKEKTCSNCHLVDSGSDNGNPGANPRPEFATAIAPNLAHVASRRWLAGGAIPNTTARLADWLHDPARAKPGARMPNLGLTPPEVTDLVSYLESLR
ncbi:MAG: cytochrome c oxidase subunit II [Polyangiaceae bacterium]